MLKINRNELLGKGAFSREDIKIKNVLLTSNLQAKICDFGFAINEEDTSINCLVGTPYYLAPELIKSDRTDKIYKYTKSIDLFAFSLVLWMIYHQVHQHQYPSIKLLCDARLRGVREHISLMIPDEIQLIITRCWAHNPTERLSIKEIKDILVTMDASTTASSSIDQSIDEPVVVNNGSDLNNDVVCDIAVPAINMNPNRSPLRAGSFFNSNANNQLDTENEMLHFLENIESRVC